MVPIACLLDFTVREISCVKIMSPRKHSPSVQRSIPAWMANVSHERQNIRGVGNQWQSPSTYSARSRFRPSFFPNEHGTRSDKLPSFDTRQPFGDQRQDSPGDGLEDDLAVTGAPNANVGQRRSLHRTATSAEYEVWKRRKLSRDAFIYGRLQIQAVAVNEI